MLFNFDGVAEGTSGNATDNALGAPANTELSRPSRKGKGCSISPVGGGFGPSTLGSPSITSGGFQFLAGRGSTLVEKTGGSAFDGGGAFSFSAAPAATSFVGCEKSSGFGQPGALEAPTSSKSSFVGLSSSFGAAPVVTGFGGCAFGFGQSAATTASPTSSKSSFAASFSAAPAVVGFGGGGEAIGFGQPAAPAAPTFNNFNFNTLGALPASAPGPDSAFGGGLGGGMNAFFGAEHVQQWRRKGTGNPPFRPHRVCRPILSKSLIIIALICCSAF